MTTPEFLRDLVATQLAHTAHSNDDATLDLELREEPLARPFLREGTIVDGRFQVMATLGMGGMGHVVRAWDSVLERDVALKFLNTGTTLPEWTTKRFFTEARALAQVRHLNVVGMHTVGEHGGVPYLVMDYVEGGTLRAWGGSQPVEASLSLLRQVGAGLRAIHEAGIAHRDLKPSNILLGEGFLARIADLGLARFVGGDASTGSLSTVVGTPAYMAPEAIVGKVRRELASRVDIYALGVLAFELLTGQLPFRGKQVVQMMAQHLSVPPPAPSQINPSLPAGIDARVLAALAKDPAGRPSSATSFVQGICELFPNPRQDSAEPVLVVDFRGDLAVSVAQSAGHRHVVVSDPAEARTVARQMRCGLVLIDFDTDGLAPFETLAALRHGDPAYRPHIVACARSGSIDWDRVMKLGATSFATTPLRPGRLDGLAGLRH